MLWRTLSGTLICHSHHWVGFVNTGPVHHSEHIALNSSSVPKFYLSWMRCRIIIWTHVSRNKIETIVICVVNNVIFQHDFLWMLKYRNYYVLNINNFLEIFNYYVYFNDTWNNINVWKALKVTCSDKCSSNFQVQQRQRVLVLASSRNVY